MNHATNRSLLVLLFLALSVGCGSQESSQSSRPDQDSAEHAETTPVTDQPEDEPTEEIPSSGDDAPNDLPDGPDPINGEEVDSDENPTDVPENEEPEATDTDPTTPSDPVDDVPEVPILSECEEDYHYFADEVWPSVFEARCVGCHQTGSLAEDSRMVFAPNPTATQHLENFNAAWVMALYLEEYESLLLRKPSGRSVEPHGGGTLLSTSSREYALLQQWVQRAHDAVPCGDDDNPPTHSDPTDTSDPTEQTGTGDPTEDNDTGPEVEPLPTLSELAPGRRLLRRLSHAEYDASLRAILGESTDAAANLAADNVVNGYTNNADALTVSPLLAAQYAELAEELGLRVAYQNTNYQACVAVESAGTCFRNLLIELGTKLFRRPLKNEELIRYFDLWYGIAQEDGELEGTRWAFTALLQSPHFLYRAELGSQEDGEYKLSQYEIASQLAFNLTGLPPDADLMDAARDGRLTTDNDRSIAATRLIQSAEGQAHFGRFLAAWLGLDSIETVARNTSLYPEFTPGIRTDMLWQTLQTGSTWLERDVAFSALFTSPLSFISDSLATFYGFDAATTAPNAQGLRETTLPSNYPAGILSHGSVLATYAKASASSPIHRGVLVRERVLCQELAPPPPNLDTSPPAVDPSQSTRERYIEHASNPACSSCHDLIDPIGFGFEHYDAVGRWRAQDGVHSIDASGSILYSPSSDTEFQGLQELAAHLATSADVEACFIEQWSEYLYGLHHDATLEPTVDALKAHFAQSEKTLQATLSRFVQIPHVTARAWEQDVERPIYGEDESLLTISDLLDGRPDFNEETSGSGNETPPVDNGDSLVVTQSEASRWDSGACFDVIVTNTSNLDQNWQVQISVEGTINNIWNAEVIATQGTSVTVVGLSWNNLLSPQSAASFGYCVGF